MWNWITLIGGGVVTALPMVVNVLPPPYNVAATMVLGFATSLYHLYQPAPVSR